MKANTKESIFRKVFKLLKILFKNFANNALSKYFCSDLMFKNTFSKNYVSRMTKNSYQQFTIKVR